MTRQYWLIAYDVSCARRLVRVHSFLKDHSLPLQYSVFIAELTELSLNHLVQGLATRIDPRSDDVRAYPLRDEGAVEAVGRRWIAEGLTAGLTSLAVGEFRI